MKAPPIDPVYARRQLPEVLHLAATHLSERGDSEFFNDEPEVFTTFQLASFIEQCAEHLATGNETDLKRLWIIFAVASTWDDASGDSHLGQIVFNHIDTFYRPA